MSLAPLDEGTEDHQSEKHEEKLGMTYFEESDMDLGQVFQLNTSEEAENLRAILRPDWRFGSIVAFMSAFRNWFGLGSYTVAELEQGILYPESSVLFVNLAWRLVHNRNRDLRGCDYYIISSLKKCKDLHFDKWNEALAARYTDVVEQLYLTRNPMDGDAQFAFLPIPDRLEVLHNLCQWQILYSHTLLAEVRKDEHAIATGQHDAQARENGREPGTSMDWIRPRPFGQDDEGNTYWHFASDDAWIWCDSSTNPSVQKASRAKRVGRVKADQTRTKKLVEAREAEEKEKAAALAAKMAAKAQAASPMPSDASSRSPSPSPSTPAQESESDESESESSSDDPDETPRKAPARKKPAPTKQKAKPTKAKPAKGKRAAKARPAPRRTSLRRTIAASMEGSSSSDELSSDEDSEDMDSEDDPDESGSEESESETEEVEENVPNAEDEPNVSAEDEAIPEFDDGVQPYHIQDERGISTWSIRCTSIEEVEQFTNELKEVPNYGEDQANLIKRLEEELVQLQDAIASRQRAAERRMRLQLMPRKRSTRVRVSVLEREEEEHRKQAEEERVKREEQERLRKKREEEKKVREYQLLREEIEAAEAQEKLNLELKRQRAEQRERTRELLEWARSVREIERQLRLKQEMEESQQNDNLMRQAAMAAAQQRAQYNAKYAKQQVSSTLDNTETSSDLQVKMEDGPSKDLQSEPELIVKTEGSESDIQVKSEEDKVTDENKGSDTTAKIEIGEDESQFFIPPPPDWAYEHELEISNNMDDELKDAYVRLRRHLGLYVDPDFDDPSNVYSSLHHGIDRNQGYKRQRGSTAGLQSDESSLYAQLTKRIRRDSVFLTRSGDTMVFYLTPHANPEQDGEAADRFFVSAQQALESTTELKLRVPKQRISGYIPSKRRETELKKYREEVSRAYMDQYDLEAYSDHSDTEAPVIVITPTKKIGRPPKVNPNETKEEREARLQLAREKRKSKKDSQMIAQQQQQFEQNEVLRPQPQVVVQPVQSYPEYCSQFPPEALWAPGYNQPSSAMTLLLASGPVSVTPDSALMNEMLDPPLAEAINEVVGSGFASDPQMVSLVETLRSQRASLISQMRKDVIDIRARHGQMLALERDRVMQIFISDVTSGVKSQAEADLTLRNDLGRIRLQCDEEQLKVLRTHENALMELSVVHAGHIKVFLRQLWEMHQSQIAAKDAASHAQTQQQNEQQHEQTVEAQQQSHQLQPQQQIQHQHHQQQYQKQHQPQPQQY